jgi:hypothetical protein
MARWDGPCAMSERIRWELCRPSMAAEWIIVTSQICGAARRTVGRLSSRLVALAGLSAFTGLVSLVGLVTT